MFSAAVSGFLISLSLILAIGPQNSFVIRQGLASQYVSVTVLFCGLSDALLICLGVLGLGRILAPLFHSYSDALFVLSALWLAGHGFGRARAAFSLTAIAEQGGPVRPGSQTLTGLLATLSVLTFANPHVYLDTVVLLGAISAGYESADKVAFAGGASLASLTFFALLGFGARKFSFLMTSRRAWQLLDAATAAIMVLFAVLLFAQTSWFQAD